MFTGIIEKIGTIKALIPEREKISLQVNVQDFTDDIKIGSSIAVDGVCLTMTKFLSIGFEVDAVRETISNTTLSEYRIGREVNLEKAMRISDRLDGHIVQGHVDGMAVMTKKYVSGTNVVLTFQLPPDLINGVVSKGSIAIDGTSLTVAELNGDNVSVAVIPLTLELTILGKKRIGEKVNIEVDILGKYVRNMLKSDQRDNKPYLYF